MQAFGVFDFHGRLFALYERREGAEQHRAFMNDHDDYESTEFFVQPITLNRPNKCPVWEFDEEHS